MTLCHTRVEIANYGLVRRKRQLNGSGVIRTSHGSEQRYTGEGGSIRRGLNKKWDVVARSHELSPSEQ